MATTLIHRLLVQVPAPHLFGRCAECNLNMRNRTELEKPHILFRTWQEKPIDDILVVVTFSSSQNCFQEI